MGKRKKVSWAESMEYRKWVNQRDQALEVLFANARMRLNNNLRSTLTEILQSARANYSSLKDNPYHIDKLEKDIGQYIYGMLPVIHKIIFQMRKRSYILAKASETEIIARLRPDDHPTTTTIKATDTHQKAAPDWVNLPRLKLYLDKLRRKIISAAQTAAITQKDERSFLVAVLNSFPKKRKMPKRALLKPVKKMREAGQGQPKADFAIDNIDDEEWQDMVDDYMADEIPPTRGPEFVAEMPEGIADEDAVYGWELEKDLAHEFVDSVRSGQSDAANENGITDFVWIAIVDQATCDDCVEEGLGCVDFDGHLTSEVEEMTKGEVDVPPAHFNCRCTMAPATDDMPDIPDDGAAEFADWLDS